MTSGQPLLFTIDHLRYFLYARTGYSYDAIKDILMGHCPQSFR